jgi:hypothetical protein
MPIVQEVVPHIDEKAVQALIDKIKSKAPAEDRQSALSKLGLMRTPKAIDTLAMIFVRDESDDLRLTAAVGLPLSFFDPRITIIGRMDLEKSAEYWRDFWGADNRRRYVLQINRREARRTRND